MENDVQMEYFKNINNRFYTKSIFSPKRVLQMHVKQNFVNFEAISCEKI